MSGKGKQESGPSYGEIELARVSREELKDYKKRGMPLEAAQIKRLRGLKEQGPLAAGMGAADAFREFEPVLQRAKAKEFTSGAKGGSGRQVMKWSEIGLSRAGAASRAATSGAQDATSRYLTGMTKMVAAQRGIKDVANVGLRASAQVTARNAATEAAYEQAKQEQNMDLFGTVAGAGASGLSSGKFGSGTWSGKGLSGTKNFFDVTAGPRRL